MKKPVRAYIGIGSNMGDRPAFCREAVRLVSRFPTTSIVTVSSLYETAPLERADQDWFINCVVSIDTLLPPRELLRSCQEVEQFLGRKRTVRFGPRTIDMDVLLYGDKVIQETDLTIPHPRLHQRRFVLDPLNEIVPDLEHPVLRKKIHDILAELKDTQEVRRWASFQPEQKAG